MGAYENLDKWFAGMKQGVDGNETIETLRAAEDIDNGVPIFVYEGDNLNGYNVKQDTSTITLDAELITGNTITTTVSIDGVAQTPVASVWTSSHDDTMDLHLADLEAAISDLVVTLTDLSTNLQFTLLTKGKNISLVTSVVTGGSTQAGTVIAYTCSQVFAGIAVFVQRSFNGSVGVYPEDEAMNNMTRGKIVINTSKAVNANTQAYVIWDYNSADQGKFTDVATDNYETKCTFRSNTTDANLAEIEVNGQHKDATP